VFKLFFFKTAFLISPSDKVPKNISFSTTRTVLHPFFDISFNAVFKFLFGLIKRR